MMSSLILKYSLICKYSVFIYNKQTFIPFDKIKERSFQDYSLLNTEESKYAANINTHINFLIYNRASKQPVLAIETKGYAYHKSGTIQLERDIKKEHILQLYGISLVRLSTIGSYERKFIENKWIEILH